MKIILLPIVCILRTFVLSDGATLKTTVKSKLRVKNPLEKELETGCNVTIRDHPNLHLLPNLTTCGNSYKRNVAKPIENVTPNFLLSSKDDTELDDDEDLVRRKRITGGTFAKLGKYPWVCQIFFVTASTPFFQCGCTLINDRYVLTAAHCTVPTALGSIPDKVVLGNVDRGKNLNCLKRDDCVGCKSECSDKQEMEIEEIIIHPDFVQTSLYNDIALIRLATPVKFTKFISPICLPRDESFFTNWSDYKLTVTGWGSTTTSELTLSEIERDLKIPLVPRKVCDDHYTRMIGKLDGTRLCGGGLPGQGDCKGDSGSPLQREIKIPGENQDKNEHWVQFGIVSYGYCALEGVPGTYTNVMYYMPWILSNMEP